MQLRITSPFFFVLKIKRIAQTGVYVYNCTANSWYCSIEKLALNHVDGILTWAVPAGEPRQVTHKPNEAKAVSSKIVYLVIAEHILTCYHCRTFYLPPSQTILQRCNTMFRNQVDFCLSTTASRLARRRAIDKTVVLNTLTPNRAAIRKPRLSRATCSHFTPGAQLYRWYDVVGRELAAKREGGGGGGGVVRELPRRVIGRWASWPR